MTSTTCITHRKCQLHDVGSHHPECPQRLTAINDHLIAQGIDAYFTYHDAPLATFEQLPCVHPASHRERSKRAAPEFVASRREVAAFACLFKPGHQFLREGLAS